MPVLLFGGLAVGVDAGAFFFGEIDFAAVGLEVGGNTVVAGREALASDRDDHLFTRIQIGNGGEYDLSSANFRG